MSEEIKAKLFQPFFTTKQPGEGTGLGLALSYGIIQEHGGTIKVDTAEGRGTTFRIDLPITPVQETVGAEPVVIERGKHNVNGARILVVDDEQTVGALVKAILTDEGHEVTYFSNPEEALANLGENSYDLIILDIRMPRMSGVELYDEINNRWPAQAERVILLTGDTSDLLTRQYLNTIKVPYITKPFERAELEDKVRSVLSKNPNNDLSC
jgi:CheY-like chemotaxis protein